MRKLLRHKHWEFILALLAARRAQNSAEAPLVRAKRTVQKSPATVALGAQHAKQGKGIARRAKIRRPVRGIVSRRLANKLRVCLHESARQKFSQHWSATIRARHSVFVRSPAIPPVVGEQLYPRSRPFPRYVGCRRAQRLWRVCLHQRQKARILWQQNR